MSDEFAGHAAVRRVSIGAWLAGATAFLLLAGCDQRPAAFPERDFAPDSDLAVRPGEIVVLHLEATGTHDGDTGTEEGVDRIPFDFPEAGDLTLGGKGEEDTSLHVLVLLDANGNEMGRTAPEGEPVIVSVAAGLHFVEVHHERKGETDATTDVVFLGTPPDPIDTSRFQSGGGCIVEKSNETRYHVTGATKCCSGCDFSDADLSNLSMQGSVLSSSNLTRTNFSGSDLNNSCFEDATITDTNFQGADLTRADFIDSRINGAIFDEANLTTADFAFPGSTSLRSSSVHRSSVQPWIARS